MKLPRTTHGKYVVEAVAKALDLLEAFRGSEELPLHEISRRAELNKSRGFRLLHTLANRGYIEKAPSGGRYRLGAKLFERAAHVGRDLKRIAQPFMRQLHAQFNDTVNLGIIHSGEALYIDILESARAFRMAATVGSRSPVFSTAMGKAIAAYLPEAELGKWFGSDRRLLNRRTTAEQQTLINELQAVRRKGYALDNEDHEPGVASIGAPVFDSSGRVAAALSVSGPVGRILGSQKQIVRSLVTASHEISRQMGFSVESMNRSGNRLRPSVSRSGKETLSSRERPRRRVEPTS